MKSDELFALLRRRGFLWPTAEIYGGAQGLYDYGPLGAALKRRIEEAWTAWFVGLSDDYYLIDAAELLPEAVVRASGHLENFTDPEVRCDHCQNVFRAETVLEKTRPEGVDGLSTAQIAELVRGSHARCPSCGSTELSVPQPFNMMFGVEFGVTGRERAYLRPETAQSSYLAFPRMWDVGRKALPLGIAVIGKAYRNEIAPRQVLFRMRAFTQAELQVFFDPQSFPVPRPGADAAPRPVHLAHTYRFFRQVLGYPADAIRLFEKSEKERAFYNRIQFDVEVRLESLGGFRELGAVHYRGDYDLGRHTAGSGKDLSVLVAPDRRVLPHVLEMTFGVDRNFWALADSGISAEEGRTVWRIPAYLAPMAVGVLPLIHKEHGPRAREILRQLQAAGLSARYDESGTIGRRYARLDEAGTPFAVTVDGETIAEGQPTSGTVTLRERDSRSQSRVPVGELVARISPALLPPRPPPG